MSGPSWETDHLLVAAILMEEGDAQRGPVSILGQLKIQTVITSVFEKRGLTQAAARACKDLALAGTPAGVVDASVVRAGEADGYACRFTIETRVQSDF